MRILNNQFWRQVIPDRKKIVVFGAGNQARVNIPILESLGTEVVAFIDHTDNIESPLISTPLFSSTKAFVEHFNVDQLSQMGSVIAIGNPFGQRRVEFSNVLAEFGVKPISFADASAKIRSDSRVALGAQIMPGVIINNNVIIEENCIINTAAIVEHDCLVRVGVEVGPRAILLGEVSVGRYSWIGAGAIVLPRLKIGENAVVGAGAVVTKDVAAGAVVVGCPAREVSRNMS